MKTFQEYLSERTSQPELGLENIHYFTQKKMIEDIEKM